MKITKEQFNRLLNPYDITKGEYDKIESLIDERFSEVVMLIQPNITKKGWFVYGNYNENGEGDEGHFDTIWYKEWIDISGECSFPAPYSQSQFSGNASIPTRWLWTDDVEILKEYNEEVEKAKKAKQKEKELEKKKRTERNEKRKLFQNIIRNKLTKEELKYIKFK